MVTKDKSKATRNVSDRSKSFLGLDPSYGPKKYGTSNKSLPTQSSAELSNNSVGETKDIRELSWMLHNASFCSFL